ncbi:MAG TPA: exodeoxyribonuclease I [Candidatus Saccharimonadales bacterium]|nr:exodeoxyribonuclease I [Candidatus Saccharimonadales bacterium]
MSQTLFFYDLETSGLNSRSGRIMQFAGQRTDMDLKPLGQPVNLLVKLSDDILPDPGAIMVTGITPQKTVEEGYSEPEFCKFLDQEVFTPGTVTIGYNNVRFDDEFIRHTMWRNFYDPYEWAWSDERSRWDVLDVVRLVRALRPDGINWPVNADGKPVNKLEMIAKANNLTHTRAHDALSDVEVLIDLTRLIKTKQPKMFDYLFNLRNKKAVSKLVGLDEPKAFVYASGRYDDRFEKTTVAYPISLGSKPNSLLVYDLRYDPTPFAKATPRALSEVMFASKEQRADPSFVRLPVKELTINKCPAVAPLGVLDDDAQKRISLKLDTIKKNLDKLVKLPDFGDRVREAYEMREPYPEANDVEAKLYDSFTPDQDKPRLSAIRAASADELADFHPNFADERLGELLLRYKARSFPTSLSQAEQEAWDEYRQNKLAAQVEPYMKSLAVQAEKGGDSFLIDELRLWVESILPVEVD